MAVMHAAGGLTELPEGTAGQFIESCYSQLAGRFDPTLGGFGAAPKFPRPAEINLLLVENLRASHGSEASSATASSTGNTLYSNNFSTWLGSHVKRQNLGKLHARGLCCLPDSIFSYWKALSPISCCHTCIANRNSHVAGN